MAANTTNNFISGNPFVTDSGVLFIPDVGNNRVLGFGRVPTQNNAAANFVLGQISLATNGAGTSATTLDLPASLHSDGTKLVLADLRNSRVLIWNSLPATSGVPADVVVGQPDFISNTSACTDSNLFNPESVILVAGKLIVADISNHRVLIWNSVPTSNGQAADVVLGQNRFTTCTSNDDDQDGVNDGAPSARTLFAPGGVWSDGVQLAVADASNNPGADLERYSQHEFHPSGPGDWAAGLRVVQQRYRGTDV